MVQNSYQENYGWIRIGQNFTIQNFPPMWSHDMTDPNYQITVCQCSFCTMQHNWSTNSGMLMVTMVAIYTCVGGIEVDPVMLVHTINMVLPKVVRYKLIRPPQLMWCSWSTVCLSVCLSSLFILLWSLWIFS